MRLPRTLARLSKGIVTDVLGAKGALLVGDDVVPLERGEGWRVRGGKTCTAITTGTDATTWPSSFIGAVQVHALDGVAAIDDCVLVEFDLDGAHRFAVVDTSGAGWVLPTQAADAAGSAITFGGRTNEFSSDLPSVGFHDEVWVPSEVGKLPMRYGGAKQTSTGVPYSTGTVSGSAGSTTLTGSGTSWDTKLTAGCYVYINDADVTDRAYRVVSVDSSTQVTLDRPLAGAVAAGTLYRATPNAWWSVKPGTFGALDHTNPLTALSTMNARIACQHQGRVVVFDTVELDNKRYRDRGRWCAPASETDGTHWGGAEYFHANAVQDTFPGEGWYPDAPGVLGAASWRGVLYVFKARGIYAWRGYLATDGTDEGLTIDRISDSVGHYASQSVRPIATSEGVYFLSADGLCLLTDNGIRNISRETGTQDLYLTMFRGRSSDDVSGSGLVTCGLSVVRNRVILSGTAAQASAVASETPNTLVYDRSLGLVYTQTTVSCRDVVAIGSDEVSVAYTSERNNSALKSQLVNWSDDNRFSTATMEGTRYPKLRILTHPLMLADRLGPAGRVRAVWVRARVNEADLAVSLYEGEGTSTSFETVVTASEEVDTVAAIDKWYRLPVRSGTPALNHVRVNLAQDTTGATDMRVMEVGVEYVPVGRIT